MDAFTFYDMELTDLEIYDNRGRQFFWDEMPIIEVDGAGFANPEELEEKYDFALSNENIVFTIGYEWIVLIEIEYEFRTDIDQYKQYTEFFEGKSLSFFTMKNGREAKARYLSCSEKLK